MRAHELPFHPRRRSVAIQNRPTRNRRAGSLICLITLVSLTSCQKSEVSLTESSKPGSEIRLFAAASTIDVVTEACQVFTKETGIDVETSFAASSTQASMLIQGVRTDLFLSASVQWSDAVRNQYPECDAVNLLGNQLVLVVPKDSKLDIASIGDLKSENVHKISIADVRAVPAGIYSKQALETAGLWAAVSNKLVGTLDVRQALAMVENGVAECGFVYRTDARTSQHVRVVAELTGHDPIVYPLLLMPNASADGRTLFKFLQTDKARTVFERHGFQVLPVSSDARTLVK